MISLSLASNLFSMHTISALVLEKAISNGEKYTIVDVREPYEYEACNIQSLHIPMGEICDRIAELPTDSNVVIMCRSGKRAEAVANILETDHSMKNIFILDGGILAWKEQVDNTLDLD